MQPPLANVFRPLINVFDAILKVFHDDIGLGWGLAIIALTVLIRLLLLPLTLKQLRSMYRMAQFTPEIKRLRDKHVRTRSAFSVRRWRSTRRTGSTRSGRSC